MSPDARRTAGANGVAPPRTSSSAQRPTSAGDAFTSECLQLHRLSSCAAHLQALCRALRARSLMSLKSCMLQAWRRQAPAR